MLLVDLFVVHVGMAPSSDNLSKHSIVHDIMSPTDKPLSSHFNRTRLLHASEIRVLRSCQSTAEGWRYGGKMCDRRMEVWREDF